MLGSPLVRVRSVPSAMDVAGSLVVVNQGLAVAKERRSRCASQQPSLGDLLDAARTWRSLWQSATRADADEQAGKTNARRVYFHGGSSNPREYNRSTDWQNSRLFLSGEPQKNIQQFPAKVAIIEGRLFRLYLFLSFLSASSMAPLRTSRTTEGFTRTPTGHSPTARSPRRSIQSTPNA